VRGLGYSGAGVRSGDRINTNKTAEIIELPLWTEVVKQHDGLQAQPQVLDAATRQALEARWHSAQHEHDVLLQEAGRFVSDYGKLQDDATKLRRMQVATPTNVRPPILPPMTRHARCLHSSPSMEAALASEVDRLEKQKRDHNLETASGAR